MPQQPLTPPLPPTTTNTNKSLSPFIPDHIAVSPSKARAQARLTTQLAEISTWLDELCGPAGLPAHLRGWQGEVLRNVDGNVGDAFLGSDAGNGLGESPVLKWLRQAKEEHTRQGQLERLLEGARREELENLRRVEDSLSEAGQCALAGTLLDQVHAGLDNEAQNVLGELAGAIVLLGAVDFNLGEDVTTAFADRIRNLSLRMGRAVLVAEELRGLKGEVEMRLVGLRREVEERSSHDGTGTEEEDDRVRDQTAQFVREAKQIRLKIAEYRERISGLERQVKMVKTGNGMDGEDDVVDQVLNAQRRVAERRERVQEMEKRLQAFGGLPPDLAASRQEVKRAQGQLEDLKKRREELFASIGERTNQHG